MPSVRGPKENINVAWTTEFDGEGLPVGVAIADDKILEATGAKSLVARSLSDGSEVWRYESSFPINAYPAVVDNQVYFGTGNLYDGEGALVGLSIEDGNEIWTSNKGFYGIVPTVTESLVLFGVGEQGMYAVSRPDGNEAWKFTPEVIINGAVATDDLVYTVAGTPRVLYALDIEDGSVEWSKETSMFDANIPAVGEHIYLTDKYGKELLAFDINDGSELWSFTPDMSQRDSVTGTSLIPALVDSQAIFAAGSALYSLDTETGSTVWEASLPQGSEFNITPPMVANDTVYASNGADLRAFKLSSGEEVWQYDAQLYSSLSVTDGYLAVVGNSELHVLREK